VKPRALGWVVAATLSIAAFVAAARAEDLDLEPIWEARDTSATVFIRVVSRGCTEAGDFKVSTNRPDGSSVRVISFVRAKADVCKMRVPGGKIVAFDKKAIGLAPYEPFRIANPFAGSPLLGPEPDAQR
jgi:hypothetical protein